METFKEPCEWCEYSGGRVGSLSFSQTTSTGLVETEEMLWAGPSSEKTEDEEEEEEEETDDA